MTLTVAEKGFSANGGINLVGAGFRAGAKVGLPAVKMRVAHEDRYLDRLRAMSPAELLSEIARRLKAERDTPAGQEVEDVRDITNDLLMVWEAQR